MGGCWSTALSVKSQYALLSRQMFISLSSQECTFGPCAGSKWVSFSHMVWICAVMLADADLAVEGKDCTFVRCADQVSN